MFGFSFRSFAEAAINTFTGSASNDEELEKLVQEIKTQETVFPYAYSSSIDCVYVCNT